MAIHSLFEKVTEEPSSLIADPSAKALRKTKILCTIGPATDTEQAILALLTAGANAFRLNFSHGDHASHKRTLDLIRRVAGEQKRPVAIIQDLCGPKIRVSALVRDPLQIDTDQVVRITTDRHREHTHATNFEYDIASTYANLLDDVKPGDPILLDDGRIELKVEEIRDNVIWARAVHGGPLVKGKGMNLPGVSLSTDSVTTKDFEDLRWGIEQEVDYVALSFVRTPADLVEVSKRLEDAKSSIRVIAKIERPEAIEHIEGILGLADGLMVARGDLGVETDLARVPVVQKALIERCRNMGKPVILATQVLESMIKDSTPTRAEVSDVANAIYDGTDCIMLSAETAVGSYPREAVAMLDRVAKVTEPELDRHRGAMLHRGSVNTGPAAIVEGAITTALGLGAVRVVVYTRSGLTARLIARIRLPMPVVAFTNALSTYHQLCLSYGTQPVYRPDIENLPQLLEELDQHTAEEGWGREGELVVVVSSWAGQQGNIDTLHIHRLRSAKHAAE